MILVGGQVDAAVGSQQVDHFVSDATPWVNSTHVLPLSAAIVYPHLLPHTWYWYVPLWTEI